MFRRIFHILKPGRKLNVDEYILIESFNGKTISGNPYYLGKYFALHFDLPLVISTNVIPKEKEKGVIYIRRHDYNFRKVVNNAKFLIVNNDIYVRGFKPKGYFIQTWHGTPLKRIGRDINDFLKFKQYIFRFEKQLGYADLLLAQNEYSKEKFKSAFNNIIEAQVFGYPKNDFFYEKHNLDFKEKLGFKKIILYAPTWRDNNKDNLGRFYKNLLDYEKLTKVLGEGTALIVKPHESEKVRILEGSNYSNIIVDTKSNLNELMYISDMLITDYSSVFFDYMHTNNKIVFYAPDKEEYETQLRDFYFPYEEENLPGKIIEDEQQLLDIINDFEIEDKDKYFAIKQKFIGIENGEVAKSIYEYVKKML